MSNLTKDEISQIKNSSLEEILGFDPFEINDRDIKDIDKEIEETKNYISRLESYGIYTDFQKEDLEFQRKWLESLIKFKKEI